VNTLRRVHRFEVPTRDIWPRSAAQIPLVRRDVTAIFRLLRENGYSQNRMAALTGMSQPEVSAVLRTRRVQTYDLLQRIFTGLAIPPCIVGMASCCSCCEHDAPTIAALAEATEALSLDRHPDPPLHSEPSAESLPMPRGRWTASGSWLHGFSHSRNG
jgi:transcriptional regulator with XRE-family HTH domain